MPPAESDRSNPLILGRYRVVRPLARGGMGVVYLARTEGAAGFARPVVIKRIVPDLAADDAATQAFVREARILSNLQHPGIVNVIDFDEEEGAYVMVLEYVHGFNLAQWHRFVVDTGRPMPVDYGIYVMTRVLDALHYAHTFLRADGVPMQIVHRDVSPGNILLDTQGHVKLLDFGIARANEGGEYRTRDGTFKGKLAYATPEVYEGYAATPRSDVYSAAVVLYQVLAKNPFRGRDIAETVHRVLLEMPPPLSTHRGDVSPELDAIVQKALAKNPEERFPTAAAFAEELRAARPRPEREFATDLVDEIWNDFNGDMPEALGVERLQVLDSAWRVEHGDKGDATSSLRLSAVPRSSLEGQTGTIRETLTEIETHGPPTTAPAPASGNRALWIAIAAVGLLAIGGVGVTLWTRSPPSGAPRYVVVEKQSPPTQTPAPQALAGPLSDPARPVGLGPSAAPPPPTSASAGKVPLAAKPPNATGPVAQPAGTTPAQPDPAALSRRFQTQRGRIESCFQQHVQSLDGRPEVSIRFRLAETGDVQSAQIVPASLGGTPLGQCLTAVARSTQFGPQTEPVSFSIPITARRL